MSVREYRKKRDFSKTPEPAPKSNGKSPRPGTQYVIQKHAASRLHYDFRLEMDGVLKSWAVPKEIPFEHGDKRLAVRTEDHPLDYASFEGSIPAAEYGGGTVMVWDRGEYAVFGIDPARALEEGKLHMQLAGQKLKGEWTLVRTRGNAGEGKESWLLMKTGESAPAPGRLRDDRSAISGRTMKQIAADTTTVWNSKAEAPAVFCEPMKAKLVRDLPEREGWIFEVKFDGYRAIAVKNGSDVSLVSRNKKPLDFPDLAGAVAALPCRNAVLDGEIVALAPEGRPSFQMLQARDLGEPAPIAYYLFDLLMLDGADVRTEPLTERRRKLEALLKDAGDLLRFSPGLPGKFEDVLAQIRKRGLEGIVAKQQASRYRSGVRSDDWLKLKCVNEQEFVIGGYTQSDKRRFGAVLVGYCENGKLRFAGRAGSGFSDRLQDQLFRRFQELRAPTCPFSDFSMKPSRWRAQGMSAADIKACVWLKPELVCEVKFTEWTRDGRLRQPVFLGLREDRPADSVIRETPGL